MYVKRTGTGTGTVYEKVRLTITRNGRTWRSGRLGSRTSPGRSSTCATSMRTGRSRSGSTRTRVALTVASRRGSSAGLPVAQGVREDVSGLGRRRLPGEEPRRPRERRAPQHRRSIRLRVHGVRRVPVPYPDLALRRWQATDVTPLFPGQVALDAQRLWSTYLEHRRKDDVRGVLAAWLADEYLLAGRTRAGWRSRRR